MVRNQLRPAAIAVLALLAGAARADTTVIYDAPGSASVVSRSICDLGDTFKPAKHAVFEGAVFWDPDGRQALVDPRCPAKDLLYSMSGDLRPGSHTDDLGQAIADAEQGKYVGRALRCVVSGELVIRRGSPVLLIESVERIWAS